MRNFYDTLGFDAQAVIGSGYYNCFKAVPSLHLSLKKAICECNRNPVIAEIKCASPTLGNIRECSSTVEVTEIAKAMERGGAVALSVLTEPRHFKGSIDALADVRLAVKLPLLMKDIVLSQIQVAAAARLGADAILLIKALYDRGFGECDLDSMIEYVQANGLEVLLEAHTEKEFKAAKTTNADVIGINNRNLANLKVDINTTKKILKTCSLEDLVIVSESGINTPADLRFLSQTGVSAFLIGSSIMLTDNVEEKVREFVNA